MLRVTVSCGPEQALDGHGLGMGDGVRWDEEGKRGVPNKRDKSPCRLALKSSLSLSQDRRLGCNSGRANQQAQRERGAVAVVA